ncbi:hypothetical protein LCGC14_3126110, partial [marine sediment metagenome]
MPLLSSAAVLRLVDSMAILDRRHGGTEPEDLQGEQIDVP